jgi:uncharacterized protein YjbI with pentapeptide repeats
LSCNCCGVARQLANTGANLDGANLYRANIDDSVLDGASFIGATIRGGYNSIFDLKGTPKSVVGTKSWPIV